MERFKKHYYISLNMLWNKKGALDILIDSLIDEIKEETSRDGAFWWVDERYRRFTTFKFAFERDTAFELAALLIHEMSGLDKYNIARETTYRRRGLFAEYDYRQPPAKAETKLSRTKRIRKLLHMQEPEEREYDPRYFGRTYVVEPNSDEARKFLGNRAEFPNEKWVLIVDTRNGKEFRNGIYDLLKAFQSTYRNLKTPSET